MPFGFNRNGNRRPSPHLPALALLGAALMAPPMVPTATAQPRPPTQPDAGTLLRDIERLSVVGSVLYVAAHPDDENTRLIAWLVGQKGLRTAYLSMTRGGGGQNLIGPEQSEMLGVVRTGELLGARSVDGAEQRFSRARDFGYSKSPEETLAVWGRDSALADVVWTFRSFRPDVVITRFEATGPNHGHHTASAILADEAFDAAGDAKRFPEQLGTLAVFTPDRLLHNQSHWRITPDTDTSKWLRVDVGAYDAARGRSYGEIAAESRTMHKSQGFGSAPQIGPQLEYFTPLKGPSLAPDDDPLKGLDFTWKRFPGTEELAATLARAAAEFDPRAPHAVLPILARAHGLMKTVPDPHWRAIKTAELERVMAHAAGLWATARAEQAAVAPGAKVKITTEFVNRSPAEVALKAIGVSHHGRQKGVGLTDPDRVVERDFDVELPADLLTVPHWLAKPPTPASYVIDDPAARDRADTPAALQATFEVTIAGAAIDLEVPVEYAWTDAVAGERSHPLEVLPPVTATFDEDVLMLPHGRPGAARVTLRATTKGGAKGTLALTAPAGFTVKPARVDFELTDKAPEQVVPVTVTAAKGASTGSLTAAAKVGGRSWSWQQSVVDYPHLPRRTVLRPATLDLKPLAIDRGKTQRVGYIAGPGDRVAEALRAVGYTVEEVDEQGIVAGDLKRYDAVVVGVRAYNTRPRLMALHAPLMDYVKGGGRLIVQYNTNNRFNPLDGPIGPYPFQITRDRVTDEAAAMTPVDPKHPALTKPNRLGDADYADWVQERGLYFAGDWDPRYQPLFSAQDAGEKPLLGSTIVGRHGKGVFVYTGLSLFRQLPAGVPGAYRLLANLLAL